MSVLEGFAALEPPLSQVRWCSRSSTVKHRTGTGSSGSDGFFSWGRFWEEAEPGGL